MQSNNQQIREQVIDRLLALGLRCPISKTDNPVGWGKLAEEYIDAIYERKLSPQSLHDGMTTLRNTWKYSRWPTIAEILEALQPPQHVGTAEISHKPKPLEWADEVMKLPEGQEALREGFGRELWCWARANRGQVPGADVVADCRAEEEKFRANLRQEIDNARNMEHSGKDPMKALLHSIVLSAGATMDARENQLKKDFLASRKLAT